MSFTHFEWIGHLDPSDPYDLLRPITPKAVRPLKPEAIERRIAGSPMPVDHMVRIAESGYVQFVWTTPPLVDNATIEWFVCGLADDENAVVMNQRLEIWYPEKARMEFRNNASAIEARLRKSSQVGSR